MLQFQQAKRKCFAEDIVFYLSKKKILNQENRAIYEYAIEVILLNFSILVMLLLISIFWGQQLFFVCYVIFFVPLRVFSGGYHAKKSETCFGLSVALYVLAMMLSEYKWLVYNVIMSVVAIIMMFVIFLCSPIENVNHPLAEMQRRRNKMIVRIIILSDVALFVVLYINGTIIASYEIIFILLNGITFFLGKLENYKQYLNHVEKQK